MSMGLYDGISSTVQWSYERMAENSLVFKIKKQFNSRKFLVFGLKLKYILVLRIKERKPLTFVQIKLSNK